MARIFGVQYWGKLRAVTEIVAWNYTDCRRMAVGKISRGSIDNMNRIEYSAKVQSALWAKYRWHKKRELLKNPTKIEEITEKKNIDRNWTTTTCLLRDSNPYYQCLKITSCRWRPPPRMHSFTATTHFKSSLSFVSPCVCCMLCRMRLCRLQHTQGDTKERELFKCVVTVKECICGGERHLQDVIFKHW